MKLFLTSFWIAAKHSSRRLLCLFCVFFLLLGVVFACLKAVEPQQFGKARVAIVNLDSHPLSNLALRSAASMKSLSELFELQFVDEQQAKQGNYTAVLTIPEGFIDSVLNGQNKSPHLSIHVTSPLEAMWVRQLAQAGAEYLTSAQLGIYAVQETVDYGRSLPDEDYERLLMGINLVYINDFLNRLDLLAEQTLSSSGELSLWQYYAASLMCMLFFSYGFLFAPSVQNLRRFAGQVYTRKTKWTLYAAAVGHTMLLYLLCTVLCMLAIGGRAALDRLPVLMLFTLLVSSFSCLLASLFSRYASCTCALISLAVGMGVCAGGLLPLTLMPALFERIAPWTPLYQGIRLLSFALGEQMETGTCWTAVGMSLVSLIASAAAWTVKRGEC